MRLRITDDLSGVSDPGWASFSRPPSTTTVGSVATHFKRVGGDEYDGWYSDTITVPAGMTPGPYELDVSFVHDASGNAAAYVRKSSALVAGTPGQPTAVTAQALGDALRSVTLTWVAPGDDGGNAITGYSVSTSATSASWTATGTSWSGSLPDVPADQDVTFTVRAMNAGGSGLPSAPSAPIQIPAAVPAAPASVTAWRSGDGQATLTWPAAAAHGAPITGYTVTTLPGGQTTSVAAESVVATVGGLSEGATYSFTVTATNEVGTSAPTSSNTVTAAGMPTAVTGLVAVPGDGSVDVSWQPAQANGSTITGYTVTALPGGASVSVDAAATAATLSGLTNGTAYTVSVRATSDVGTASPASVGSVVPAGVPGAVSTVTAEAGDHDTVRVHWQPAAANGSPITGYAVRIGPVANTVIPVAADATSTEITEDFSYFYPFTFTVTAINAMGSGPGSSSGTVQLVPPTPGRVTGVSAVPGDASATVSWNPADTNGMQINTYTVTAQPSGATQVVSGYWHSFSFPGLTNGTAYTFTVTAANVYNSGAPSDPSASVVPAGVPMQVTNLHVTRGDRRLDLTWAPAAANGSAVTGYTVIYAGITRQFGPDTTGASLTGLANGTSYQVSVAAVNAQGTGPAASVVGIPAAAPTAVAKPTAKVKGHTVTITWRAPGTNGSAITAYVITGGPSSKTVGGGTRSLKLKLKPGTYKFRVVARNGVGSAPAGAYVKVRVAK